ncbi:MAG: sulfatase-like hydrolase/transferase [Rikenellaceae bacterium]
MKSKNLNYGMLPLSLAMALGAGGCAKMQSAKAPNVLIIMTDEQSFRTLGCYREQLDEQHGSPWGEGLNVETPHLDRLAHEGAIYTNYYASSPVSTPSRATLQTGLYPVATGAAINGMSMSAKCTGFAQRLKGEGYHTTYVGKWHLAGVPPIGELYLQPGYDFGYIDREYMFESGHAKWYHESGDPLRIAAMYAQPKPMDSDLYSTDYLTNRCLEKLEKLKDQRFCMMLSIPDPHSPDISREPYTAQYKSMDLAAPETYELGGEDKRPGWAVGGKSEAPDFDAVQMQKYFGMVKCIDDNIGRVLGFLDDNNLAENTIVIFTCDHGDMLFEHHRLNKDVPYEAAAKVPMLVRYPRAIKAGKVIEGACSNIDFVPTLLALTGSPQIEGVHGQDISADLLSDVMRVTSERIVYMHDSPFNEWTAATDSRYKLVLSCKDTPWLYDKLSDPMERVNLYSDPKHKAIAERLQAELLRQMELFEDPAIALGRPYLLSADAKNNYVPIYDGLSPKQIKEVETETLDRCIRDIHKYCYSGR